MCGVCPMSWMSSVLTTLWPWFLCLVLVWPGGSHAALTPTRRYQPLHADALILVATHTHTGAGALGARLWERLIMGLYDPQIFTQVADRIAQAALSALRQPIGVTAAVGQTRIDALVANRMEAQLSLPQTLKVLQFQAPSGRIVGRLLFMAAHPTLTAWRCRAFSADYPGVLTHTLEQHDPGSVAVFVQGAAGDLAPQTAAGPAPRTRSTGYGVAPG